MPKAILKIIRGSAAPARWRARMMLPRRSGGLVRRLALLTVLMLSPAGVLQAVAAGPEFVSMPFACSIEGRRLRLDPAPERTYRIVGPRQQQLMRTCTDSGSRTCRSLELHRFTFDCDGYRVQWIDAALAAAHRRGSRASMAGGRLTLRHWPDWPGSDRLLPLTLPVGFAPDPARGLRFIPAEPRERIHAPEARAPRDVPPEDRRDPIDTLPTVLPPIRHSPESVDTTVPTPAFVPVLAASSGTEPSAAEDEPPPLPRIGHGWTATVAPSQDSPGRFRWDALLPGSGPHALLAGIGVAALLLSATAVAARQGASFRPQSLGRPTGASPIAAAVAGAVPSDGPPPLKQAEPPPPPPKRPPLPRGLPPVDADVAVGPPSVHATAGPASLPDGSDWSAVVEMRTTAGALMALVHQIVTDHVPGGALRDVLVTDLQTIAGRLDGAEMTSALERGRLDMVHPVYAQAILDLERVRTLARIEHQRALEVAGGAARTPATLDEACAYLGVNPRAGEAVIKKVVDALRQNWHPDLALDEADRRARDERIKRINAAWDLIRAR